MRRRRLGSSRSKYSAQVMTSHSMTWSTRVEAGGTQNGLALSKNTEKLMNMRNGMPSKKTPLPQ